MYFQNMVLLKKGNKKIIKIDKNYSEPTKKLLELQEKAKAAGKGKWASAEPVVRTVHWTIDDPRALVDKYNHKPVDAVIEMVQK